MAKIKIFTDGGSRGNPGEAALGVFITNENDIPLFKIGKRLGIATNNFAEYSAIIEGLNWVNQNKEKEKIEEVSFFMDSLLAYSQIGGVYKIKNDNIREMIFEIKKLESEINLPIHYSHIPREKNKNADLMVNLALDNKL